MTQAGSQPRCAECGGRFGADMTCRKCGALAPSASPAGGPQPAAGAPVANGTARNSGSTTGSTSGRTSGSGRSSTMTTSTSTVMRSTTVRRQKLGFGLVDLPAPVVSGDDRFVALRAAERDADVVIQKLMKRGLKCGNCGKPVNRVKGFCTACTQPYDYTPLPAGALIDADPDHPGTGARAVAGFLGAGAMGVVYAAWNFMSPPTAHQLALLEAIASGADPVSIGAADLPGRAEVVKVVLNATNKAQAAAALAEMQSATRVEHPGMARLYSYFVGHTASGASVNCMAMEFVSGQMLATMREQNNAPLPLAQAIALLLPVADFLNYLHSIGYTLTDIKGDNLIFSPSGTKVVDAGGLHPIGKGGAFQVAPLYAAPEIRRTGPTPQSDVFALFQTLSELSLTGFGSTIGADNPLSPAGDEPVFRDGTLGSVARKLFARGLALDAHQRFGAGRTSPAAEAAEQMMGVLRQLTADSRSPRGFESAVFGADVGDAIGSRFSGPDHRALPALRPNTQDPGYGLIAGAEAIPIESRAAFFEQAATNTPDSVELPLAAISARITAAADDPTQLRTAAQHLEQRMKTRIAAEEVEFADLLAERAAQGARIRDEDRVFSPAYDWREDWLRGRIGLALGESGPPRAAFEQVDDAIPGELAPKLALAMASEQAGDLDTAAQWYGHVSRTDPSSTTANFGRVRCLIRAPGRTLVGLQQAAEVLQALQTGGDRLSTHQLGAELLLAAIPLANAAGTGASSGATAGTGGSNAAAAGISGSLLGVPIRERELRFGAEREFLRCCAFATTRPELADYIRQAAQARPVTLF
jgi:serine/threonine-protein kinase PknG